MLVFAMSAFAVVSASAADAAKKVPVKSARILVAYYSWSESGNTKHFAEQIQKVASGKLIEIKPKNAYPKDYNDCLAQAGPTVFPVASR